MEKKNKDSFSEEAPVVQENKFLKFVELVKKIMAIMFLLIPFVFIFGTISHVTGFTLGGFIISMFCTFIFWMVVLMMLFAFAQGPRR